MLKELAIRYMNAHKKAVENWNYGQIKKTWRDKAGNVCILYESGKWWHYKETVNGNIEWW